MTRIDMICPCNVNHLQIFRPNASIEANYNKTFLTRRSGQRSKADTSKTLQASSRNFGLDSCTVYLRPVNTTQRYLNLPENVFLSFDRPATRPSLPPLDLAAQTRHPALSLNCWITPLFPALAENTTVLRIWGSSAVLRYLSSGSPAKANS